MTFPTPWSKRHKLVTKNTKFSLSNSFAEPLNNTELIAWARDRGDEEIVTRYYEHALRYSENGGSYELRTEIAKLYGPEIGAENIVVCSSCQVALQIVAHAILQPGDHAICFSPGYQSVSSAPRQTGAECTVLPLGPENGWQIDPDRVAAAIQPNTKYIVFNSPYNPAGSVMPHDTQKALRDIADKHGIYLVNDEVYRYLEHSEADHLPGIADVYGRGVSVQGISKSWGGCGIAIGWIATQDKALLERIIDVQYFGTTCQNKAAEIQTIMALRASDIILKRNIEIIRNNLALLDGFMHDYREFFSWVRPTAGATCYIAFNGPWDSDTLGTKLAEFGVSIKPAYIFSESNEWSQYFRCGYGEKIMPKALEAFREFVELNQKEWA